MRIERDEEVLWRKQFGDRLKRLIHIKGMTQKEFAIEVGVDPAMLSKYISGVVMPSAYKVQQFAKILGCDINVLYDEAF